VVVPDEREDDGIVPCPVQEKPASSDAFADCAGLLRDPETRGALRRHHHFEPHEIGVHKAPLDELRYSRRRNAAACG
jgi:hypothetical protein